MPWFAAGIVKPHSLAALTCGLCKSSSSSSSSLPLYSIQSQGLAKSSQLHHHGTQRQALRVSTLGGSTGIRLLLASCFLLDGRLSRASVHRLPTSYRQRFNNSWRDSGAPHAH